MIREEQLKFIEDNIPLETHFHSSRKMRHTFFKNIQTEVQAYMLGFYAADGGLNEKRKTLRNNLKGYDLEKISSILEKYGYDLSVRAEQLTIEIFADIANNL